MKTANKNLAGPQTRYTKSWATSCASTSCPISQRSCLRAEVQEILWRKRYQMKEIGQRLCLQCLLKVCLYWIMLFFCNLPQSSLWSRESFPFLFEKMKIRGLSSCRFVSYLFRLGLVNLSTLYPAWIQGPLLAKENYSF